MSHLVAVAIRSVACGGIERLALNCASTKPTAVWMPPVACVHCWATSNPCKRCARAWETEIGMRTVSQFQEAYPAQWQWWIRPLLMDEIARTLVYDAQACLRCTGQLAGHRFARAQNNPA